LFMLRNCFLPKLVDMAKTAVSLGVCS
jgi:hypothetical protein